VASTKAFTCQLAAIAVLAILLGKARGTIDANAESGLVAELVRRPASSPTP
jgi:glucosamine--fructose-6-phosphate aminotransferase (isomerizing)